MLRTNAKPHQLIKHAKISCSIVSLAFCKLSYRTYWNGPKYLKAEVLRLPQKARTVLVRYLLSGIRILVYSCTGCGMSKIYLCLEDNRSSFSQVSLKSETKDARPYVHKQQFSSVCERHDFQKTKIWLQTTWRWTILFSMLNSWR